MKKHMIPFAPTQDGDKELIDLAFSKKKADERKEWLRQFKVGIIYFDNTKSNCGTAGNIPGSSIRRDSIFGIHQQRTYLILYGG